MNILLLLVVILLIGMVLFFVLLKLRPVNKKHSTLTHGQANITAIGAFILAGCSVSLSALFFYSLSDNLLTAVILVGISIGFCVAEFTSGFHIRQAWEQGNIPMVMAATALLIAGTLFSILAGQSFIAQHVEDRETERMQASDAYQQAVTIREYAAKKADMLAIDENVALNAQAQAMTIESEIASLKASLSEQKNVLSACPSNYITKCIRPANTKIQAIRENINELNLQLAQHSQTIEKRNAYLSALEHLEKVNSQPMPEYVKEDAVLPGIKTVSVILDIPVETVSNYLFLCVSVFTELAAIFMFYFWGMAKQQSSYGNNGGGPGGKKPIPDTKQSFQVTSPFMSPMQQQSTHVPVRAELPTPDIRHPLTVKLGNTDHGDLRISMKDVANMVVAGTTGGGKGNTLKSIITQLVQRDPVQVKLMLIDLKGGVTFFYFKHIPHLFVPIITNAGGELDGAIDALQNILLPEMNKRHTKLMTHECESVEHFNKKYGHYPFPYLVCIIDEISILMNERNKTLDRTLETLVSQCRSTGIRMILSTQYPDHTILPKKITMNCLHKICFRVEKPVQSDVVLGQTGAETLTKAGEGIYASGAMSFKFHADLCDEEQILPVVERFRPQQQEQAVQSDNVVLFTPKPTVEQKNNNEIPSTTSDRMLYVAKRLSEGVKQVDIAEELGIKQSSVSKLYARYQKQQRDGMRA